MAATPWYATREGLTRALDVDESVLSDHQSDAVLAAGTEAVEAWCHRVFYPVLDTRYFDWPRTDYARAWRLWLDENTLIEATAVLSGDDLLTTDEYLLSPPTGPPFSSVDINLGSSAGWSSAPGGSQRSIAITGLYGYRDDTVPAGTATEALDLSETDVEVDGPAARTLGVGSLLQAGTERMVVTGRSWADTTVNTTAALDADTSDVAVAVGDGTGFRAGEELMVDAERMLVLAVAGSTLAVQRAYRGSVLAGHALGADVYASRVLEVERGALGTTAVTHLSGAALLEWRPPALIRSLCLAEAMLEFTGQRTGYATTSGGGENTMDASGAGIDSLRAQVETAYARRFRKGAI